MKTMTGMLCTKVGHLRSYLTMKLDKYLSYHNMANKMRMKKSIEEGIVNWGTLRENCIQYHGE